jgi:hypothetical protein
MVEPEHTRLGILETRGACEFIPEETPEARAGVLAAGDGAEAEVELGFDDVVDSAGFDGGMAGGRGGGAIADFGADVEEVVGPEEGADVLRAEGWCHVGVEDGVVVGGMEVKVNLRLISGGLINATAWAEGDGDACWEALDEMVVFERERRN